MFSVSVGIYFCFKPYFSVLVNYNINRQLITTYYFFVNLTWKFCHQIISQGTRNPPVLAWCHRATVGREDINCLFAQYVCICIFCCLLYLLSSCQVFNEITFFYYGSKENHTVRASENSSATRCVVTCEICENSSCKQTIVTSNPRHCS